MTHIPHKRVSNNDCYEGFVDVFKPGRHNPIHLAERIMEFSKRRDPNLGRLQKEALEKLRTDPSFAAANIAALPPVTRRNTTTPSTSFSNAEIITKHFRFFNKLFFFGALRDLVEIVLDEHPRGIAEVCTRTRPSFFERIGLRKKKIQIRLVYTHNASRQADLNEYISTLLHEMIHVFFDVYSCKDRECVSAPEALGKTGHGAAFMDVATALERACRGYGLGMELDLGRDVALAKERVACGAEVRVSKDSLKRWGLSGGQVERAMRTVSISSQ